MDLRARESRAAFGYQLEVPKANMTFKGKLIEMLGDFDGKLVVACFAGHRYLDHLVSLSKCLILTVLVSSGSVDTNWEVSGVMEKRLQPLPFTFLLSGHMIHAKSPNFKLGCGLFIG